MQGTLYLQIVRQFQNNSSNIKKVCEDGRSSMKKDISARNTVDHADEDDEILYCHQKELDLERKQKNKSIDKIIHLFL